VEIALEKAILVEIALGIVLVSDFFLFPGFHVCEILEISSPSFHLDLFLSPFLSCHLDLSFHHDLCEETCSFQDSAIDASFCLSLAT